MIYMEVKSHGCPKYVVHSQTINKLATCINFSHIYDNWHYLGLIKLHVLSVVYTIFLSCLYLA